MKILMGYGKTTYFQHLHPQHRILHASHISELRASILSINSPFLTPLPTLINTWFLFNFAEIRDLLHYQCYIELHFPPTRTSVNNTTAAIKSMQQSMMKICGAKNLILCAIPDKILDRKSQPQLYHLQENDVQVEWTSLQYLLALGEQHESHWLSWKWGGNRIISLPSLLQEYLTQQ